MRKRYFDLRVGESVTFDGSRVTAEAKTGQRVRICIETAAEVHKGKASDGLPLPKAPQPVMPFLPRPKPAG